MFYQFKDEINYRNYFNFDKMLVHKKIWSKLPSSSKSIYPVIVVFCNRRGSCFPSQDTISILSGRTPKTVREGLSGLENADLMLTKVNITKRGHRNYTYFVDLAPKEKGRTFPLHKAIFEGGNWSKLLPSAHALYIVMRTFAFFDYEYYSTEPENLDKYADMSEAEFYSDMHYSKRDYDYVSADIDVLAEHAGISTEFVKKAQANLFDNYLILPAVSIDERDTWKIFKIPTRRFKAEWLNKEITKRYEKQLRGSNEMSKALKRIKAI